jgi:hypothetical protein
MIITKLQLAAMSRVDIPREEDRKDFYLYVDEFQNFATESFANILSEARKYRLNLIVAHQYIGQLVSDRNTVVRDAIFGNVGTLVCFRVGAEDAEFLEKEFDPTFLLNDLVNITKYNIILKLMINGVSSTPFSAMTLPPIAQLTGNEAKVIAVSRERYASKREVVEEKINKWMGSEFHSQAAEAESLAVNQDDIQEDLRYSDRVQMEQGKIRPKTETKPTITQEPAPRANEPRRHERPPGQPASHHVSRRTEHTSDRRPERHNPPQSHPKPAPEKRVENPVWETVNKLASQKLTQRIDEATSALAGLGKSLEESLAKPQNSPKPSQPHKPESKPTAPTPKNPADSKPLQEGNLKPGDKIQF